MAVLERPATTPVRQTSQTWITVIVGSAVCAAAYTAYLHLHQPGQTVIWLLFGAVAVAITRLPWASIRRALPLVVLGAALVQIPGLSVSPQSSTDAYRYVWDGRVQLAGHSPYTRAPMDDDLATLRDPACSPG